MPFTVIEDPHKGGSVEILARNPFGAANVTVGFGMMRKSCWEELRLEDLLLCMITFAAVSRNKETINRVSLE